MNMVESPWGVVTGVSVELERLSGVLSLLVHIQDNSSEIDPADFSNTMGVLRDYLDIQIKALDSIRWKPEGR